MAFFSVWDWNRNAWRIYQTPTSVSVGDDPAAPKPSVSNPIGADPDTQVKPLPPGAKLIGYEHLARGEIRREPSSLLSGADGSETPFWKRPLVMFVAGAASIGALVWWRRRRG
jgi:hypothetical protein